MVITVRRETMRKEVSMRGGTWCPVPHVRLDLYSPVQRFSRLH